MSLDIRFLAAEPYVVGFGTLLPLSPGDSPLPVQCALLFIDQYEHPNPFAEVQSLCLPPGRQSWSTTSRTVSTCMKYHPKHSLLKTDLNTDVEAAQTFYYHLSFYITEKPLQEVAVMET